MIHYDGLRLSLTIYKFKNISIIVLTAIES